MILKNDLIKGKKTRRLQGISSYNKCKGRLWHYDACSCVTLSLPVQGNVFGCLELAVGHTVYTINIFSMVSSRRRERQTPVFGL